MNQWMTAAPRLLRTGRVGGSVRVPGSKSASHRALVLAFLAGVPTEVEGLLAAEDIQHVLTALRTLGWQVRGDGSRWVLNPGPAPEEGTIFCGAAGTMLRFFTALLTTVPGTWVLDGVARLRERPIAPLVSALRQLGAEISYLGREGCAPLRIVGGTLAGGLATLDAGASSQYLSAMLLAAQRAAGPVELVVSALTSAPYVELTLAQLRRAGGRAEHVGGRYRAAPGPLGGGRITVEGDWSAACYPAAAAALGGEVTLRGLDPSSPQGDRGFVSLLSRMGAEVGWEELAGEAVCVVRGRGHLLAVDADLGAMPDQVPTLAALAPFADGTTRITGVPHLRLKESDRLAVMARELTRLGVPVVELEDGLVIHGVWATEEPLRTPAVCAVDDDHRIAMSLALVGLRRAGVSIAEPGVVAKSYPDFWRDLDALIDGGGS